MQPTFDSHLLMLLCSAEQDLIKHLLAFLDAYLQRSIIALSPTAPASSTSISTDISESLASAKYILHQYSDSLDAWKLDAFALRALEEEAGQVERNRESLLSDLLDPTKPSLSDGYLPGPLAPQTKTTHERLRDSTNTLREKKRRMDEMGRALLHRGQETWCRAMVNFGRAWSGAGEAGLRVFERSENGDARRRDPCHLEAFDSANITSPHLPSTSPLSNAAPDTTASTSQMAVVAQNINGPLHDMTSSNNAQGNGHLHSWRQTGTAMASERAAPMTKAERQPLEAPISHSPNHPAPIHISPPTSSSQREQRLRIVFRRLATNIFWSGGSKDPGSPAEVSIPLQPLTHDEGHDRAAFTSDTADHQSRPRRSNWKFSLPGSRALPSKYQPAYSDGLPDGNGVHMIELSTRLDPPAADAGESTTSRRSM